MTEKAEKMWARQFGPEHREYLTSTETLRQMAGLTLVERCELFALRFPGKTISPTRLRRYYKAAKIVRKAVRKMKVFPQHNIGRYQG